jgi:serine/threonine protein kinase
MAVVCPYCQRGANMQNPKPGQFTPKCPRCGRRFVLVVSKDPGQAPVVRPLEAEAQGMTAKVQEQTPEETSSKRPTKPAHDPDPGATGAYETPGVQDPNVTTAPPTAAGNQAQRAEKPTTAHGKPTPPDSKAAEEEPETSRGAGDATRPAGTKKAKPGIAATLGGYQVLKELGHGGMGAVYLGRQMSLDRNVALKVMKPELAHDPTFVARFTREAYAAAQLAHHNVVQIFDIGADHDTHFYSMEFVPGQSLSGLLEKHGKLDPELAAGYILQAARGLKFGHDLGMVHRDVKPDNIMLNKQGIVKVTDLGLVKLPRQGEADEDSTNGGTAGAGSKPSSLAGPHDMTRVGIAVGTPTYMAPEQGRDAAHVDARADIYSLGCTLYVLVTGRPPFSGKTTLEVLSKHATAPLVPPEAIVKRVPKELSAIVLKMMAKKPEERYADMGAVIADLEKYLGIQSSGPFSPREEHATALEAAVQRFNESSHAKLRGWLILGFFGACALAVLVCLLLGRPLLAGGFLGLGVLTPLCYQVVVGITEKTFLFLKFRELVFGSRILDWLLWIAGTAFVLLLLYLVSLLWVWIGFCIAAVLLALAFHFTIDRQVAAQREEAIAQAEKLFKSLRLNGLEEETLRRFVSKYSGKRWEEFYETLFGYEAKMTAREWDRTEMAKAREKFAAWRDPLMDWMNAKQQARREAKEKKHLQTVEEQSLKAQGIEAVEARRKAERMASVMVEEAAEIKEADRMGMAGKDKRARLRELLQAARKPDAVYSAPKKRRSWNIKRSPLGLLLGPKMRFLAGAALVAGCLLWVHQNQLISGEKLRESAASLKDIDLTKLQEGLPDISEKAKALSLPDTEPLKLPVVPTAITDLFNSFNPGVAGLILVVSALFGGWKLGLVMWPAALIAFVGNRMGIPDDLGPVTSQQASMGIGAVLAIVGVIFLRNKR